MRKFNAIIERASSISTPIRLLAADKLKAARSARMNSIPWEDTPECQALMVFMAAKRTGFTTCDSLDDFLDEIEDYTIEEDTSGVDPTSSSPEA